MKNKLRQCIVKVIRPTGEITWIEEITVNENNKITLHQGFGCIIDESENGASFKTVYNNVKNVVFTGRMYKNKEVIEIYSTLSFKKDDKVLKDFEKDLV